MKIIFLLFFIPLISFCHSLDEVMLYKNRGDFEKAVVEYYGWLDENYSSGINYEMLLDIVNIDTNYNRSLGILDKYIPYLDSNYKKYRASLYLANLYEDNFDFKKAKQTYFTAYMLSNSQDIYAYYKSAVMLCKLGKSKDCQEVLQEIIDKKAYDNAYYESILLYSRNLALKNEYTRALDLLKDNIPKKNKVEFYFFLAKILIDFKGDFENEYIQILKKDYSNTIYYKLISDYFVPKNKRIYNMYIEFGTFLFHYFNDVKEYTNPFDIIE